MSDLTIVGLEWLGGVTIFLGFILLLRYIEHRERMSMIERGLMHLDTGQSPRYPRGSSQLRGGLITAGVGFALSVGLYNLGWLLPAPLTAAPGRIGPWLLPGLIPLAIGLALVVAYYLSPPHPEADALSRENQTGKRETISEQQRRSWYLLEGKRQTDEDTDESRPLDQTGTGSPSST